MIKNYKLFKESLLNKLEGPSKEEIEKHYKNLFTDNKINIFTYYKKSLEYNFNGPSKKEVEDYLYGLYDNKRMTLEEYYELTRDYKLDVPSKEYMWKQYGFDKQYDPVEYFIHLTEGMKQISPNGLYYEWVKNEKKLFEQYINPEKIIFMDYSNTFKIYEILFDMDFRKFNTFFKEMFNKYFGDKINIDEYQIRINYKY